jgi:hypothetical protein
MSLPANFKRVRLELAREPGHPAGEHDIGYQFVVPLDAAGRVDGDLWREHKSACKVVRFRPDEELDVGHLVRRGGGWAFHYDIDGDEDDETGFRFADHVFRPGEYVSIREDSGMHTFRVAAVTAIDSI